MAGREEDWTDMVLVGRIARPHGLRGQVVVNPETDFPAERFGVGAGLWVKQAAGVRELQVATVRFHQRRPVIGFEGIDSIDAAETLAGLELRVPAEVLQPLEPGRFYHHELIGVRVETLDGAVVGEVIRVDGGTGGSRLVVAGRRGEVLIPLALDICVEIDVAAGRIRIDPPDGLLELNE